MHTVSHAFRDQSVELVVTS